MPTNRTRRSRVSRGHAAAMSVDDYDMVMLAEYWGKQRRVDDALDVVFPSDAAGRAFYRAHAATFGTLMTDANSGEPAARHYHRPGRRHELWWRYESPEHRDCRETESEQLARLGVLTSEETTLMEKEN